MDKRKIFKNDDLDTFSSDEQKTIENMMSKYYYSYRSKQQQFFKSMQLLKNDHIRYIRQALDNLSMGYQSLDASRPWLIYWNVHALDLLGVELEEKMKKRIIAFLSKCQNETGGFGGGPGQMSHLAPTYASVNALTILGTEEAYESINRKTLYQFLSSLKTKEGGFLLHKDGEIDVRGCYTALSAAKLTNILDDELAKGVADYIYRCQTYEGGISAYPGNEAHGGYAFCGLAAMMILKETNKLDIENLMYWCTRRQMSFEGGFQGRTHKLVDSCYSFWMGGCFPLAQALLYLQLDELTEEQAKIYSYLQWNPEKELKIKSVDKNSTKIEELDDPFPELLDTEWFFDQTGLQEYILLCCQNEKGGLRDKPGKSRDYYHSCYSLSGLSIAQHNPSGSLSVLGDKENELCSTNPIFNVCRDKVAKILKHFSDKEFI
eukprot:gene8431-256_t